MRNRVRKELNLFLRNEHITRPKQHRLQWKFAIYRRQFTILPQSREISVDPLESPTLYVVFGLHVLLRSQRSLFGDCIILHH